MPYDLSLYELSEEDEAAHPAWFAELTHQVPAWAPMAITRFVEFGTRDMMTWALQQLSYPFCKAIYFRMRHGIYYVSPVLVTSEDEIKKRELVFREKIRPYVENFPKLWDECKAELEGYYAKLDIVDVTKLSDIDLIDHLYELYNINMRAWKIHFIMMESSFCPYLLFEELARELIGIDDTHPTFHKLMSGFDNMAFRIDKMLWQLSERASELGLGDTFLALEAEKVAPKLKETEKGREWLAELDEFLKLYGRRMKQMLNIASPTWMEDPSLPIVRIQGFLRKVATGQTFGLDEERARLTQERKAAEQEVLAKIAPEQREWFEMLLHCAQNASSWSEEHEYWINDHMDFLTHNCVLEFGRRLVQAGTFDQVDDIWYITYEDLLKIAYAPERYNMRPRVQSLRAEWEELGKALPPPAITKMSPEEAFGWMAQAKEPVLSKLVIGALPTPKAGVQADLWGTCGAPGTAEGTARVIMGEDQFSEIQPGDILVCPATTIGWTAVFPLLSGVIVDRGGSLQHAAICSREYGIPCVLNTFEGTAKIKSGQKVRIDAEIGAIYILG